MLTDPLKGRIAFPPGKYRQSNGVVFYSTREWATRYLKKFKIRPEKPSGCPEVGAFKGEGGKILR